MALKVCNYITTDILFTIYIQYTMHALSSTDSPLDVRTDMFSSAVLLINSLDWFNYTNFIGIVLNTRKQQ